MTGHAKSLLRDQARARRAELSRALGTSAALSLATTLPSAVPKGAVVAGYWPMATELDIRSGLEALHRQGAELALPAVIGVGQALEFRRWKPGDRLEPGKFRTTQPAASAGVVVPDVILVPLLAFDRRGYRLGYGGGYYDRTLSALRARGRVAAWGIAFKDQEIAQVPNGPYDAKLDGAITEFGRIQFSTAAG